MSQEGQQKKRLAANAPADTSYIVWASVQKKRGQN